MNKTFICVASVILLLSLIWCLGYFCKRYEKAHPRCVSYLCYCDKRISQREIPQENRRQYPFEISQTLDS